MSSGLPWFAVSEDGIEDDDELSHAGGESLFAGFAGGSQLGVVSGDEWIGAAGDQGGHVERGAHGRAAAGDGAAPAQGAAVAIDRCHADQRGDFAAVEMAEFGQLGDQGAQRRLADAGDTGQEIGIGLPGRAATDRAVDVLLEFGELGLQQFDMPVDGGENPALGCPAAAVALRHHHLDDLAAPRDQLAEGLRRGVGDRPGRGIDRLGKMGDGRGIDAVGLGQFAGGAREIADLAGIDHRQRQASGGDRARDDGLVAAGGFHDDQPRSERPQPFDELRQTFTVARDGEGLATRPQMNIQPILRDIDPYKVFHVPSLRMRARLAAPATVRVNGTNGWGAGLRNGLIDPRKRGAPIRHRSTHPIPAPRRTRDTRKPRSGCLEGRMVLVPCAQALRSRGMTDEIAFLPATRLVELYRAKQLSPVEVIEESVRRLENYESATNAFVLYDPQTAVAMARASEERWRKGEPQGLLDGVPVALKDTVLTKGWPRLIGSRTIDPNRDWDEDFPVTARLRSAGAVFFGKTTTPEFGWKPVTDSPLSGVTRNPWNLERTPGGSSGGSAVAVLAGICPLAVGTDAGGSIRIPAAFCGIVGLKPTFGRVAVYPPSAFGDVAHVGPMARNVEDAALMLDASKGPDSRDWHSLPDDGISYREGVREISLKGKRVALSPTLGFAEPTPAVRAAVERAARVFAELGATVEPADPFSESPLPIFQTLALAAFWALLRVQTPQAVAVMDPGLVALCRRGESVTQEEYVAAVGQRAALGQKLRLFFDRYDHAAVADHADNGCLCRSSRGRAAEPEQFPRLDALYLPVQSH